MASTQAASPPVPREFDAVIALESRDKYLGANGVMNEGLFASWLGLSGVPEAGETIDGQAFDGIAEAAVFPGELPERPEAIFDPKAHWQVRAPRFRPPLVAADAGGRLKPPPQIRLDRALEFLIGDKLA